ncbi:zinc-ribbon domain-containing protein [Curtobacterium sp. MCPF17_002]|uniref:zinc-ribbon domain-containing protein n=1 Tax=Curtobacterium sp. MCPF17_002 TaxID=2175645 RepID=UPI000DA7C4B6|nr:zinc-ribbon domain-containing protein [Curtobacterium sp. MCPF17_002]WIB77950.1 zinc-ribbon domain-containing protein [Curtobacterium sp. MCPF17_002]
MNDLLTRRYPMTVKPLHRETESSYTRRLLAANSELETHQKQLLRAAQADPMNMGWRDVLELKTGRRFHFGEPFFAARISAEEHRCELCADSGAVRLMCTLCAKGETVLQAGGFSNPVCIRHRRWVGFDLSTRQSTVDTTTIRAALRFDKLHKQCRLTPHLYKVLQGATARVGNGPTADLSAIVTIAAAVTTVRFLEQLLRPGSDYATAYDVLTNAVSVPAGPNATTVIAALWGYFRPTFWALRHAVITKTAYEPAWVHDHAIPQHIAGAYVAEHHVVSFTSFNAEDKRTAILRIDREGLVICDNGHQHARKGRCPVCTNSVVAAGYNDLATTHPHIARELDPVLNGTTTAQNIQAAARSSLAWRCPRNRHVYWATASNRTQGGTNCGICSNRTIVPGINDLTTTHPRLAAELDPVYEAGHPATKMCAGSGDRPDWLCPDCGHRYKMSLYNRSQGAGCEPCRRARLRRTRTSLADTHPDIAAQWHPTRNNGKQPEDYSQGSNDEVYWLCPTSAAHWYPQRIDRKVQGYGCSLCSSRRLVLRVNDLATTDPLLVTEWHDYLNGSTRPELMFAGTDRYWWKCSYGHVKQQSVPNRRKSRGCTDCEPEDRILN